jgi:hypothetical protein
LIQDIHLAQKNRSLAPLNLQKADITSTAEYYRLNRPNNRKGITAVRNPPIPPEEKFLFIYSLKNRVVKGSEGSFY